MNAQVVGLSSFHKRTLHTNALCSVACSCARHWLALSTQQLYLLGSEFLCCHKAHNSAVQGQGLCSAARWGWESCSIPAAQPLALPGANPSSGDGSERRCCWKVISHPASQYQFLTSSFPLWVLSEMHVTGLCANSAVMVLLLSFSN